MTATGQSLTAPIPIPEQDVEATILIPHHPPEPTPRDIDEVVASLPTPGDAGATRVWLGEAERLLAQSTGVDRARLLRARADCLINIVGPGSAAGARDAYRDNVEAGELYEANDDILHAATSYIAAAIVAVQADHVSEALDTAVRGIIAFATVPEVERESADEAYMAMMLGNLCCQFFDYDRALQFYEIAVRSLVLPKQREQWTKAARRVIDVTVLQAQEANVHEVRKRERLLERAEDLGRRIAATGEPLQMRRTDGPRLLAAVLVTRGRAEEAWELLSGADQAAEPLPATATGAGDVALIRARCLRQLGRLPQALTQLDVAVTTFSSGRDHAMQLQALELRSLVREECGDITGALADARAMAGLVRSRQQRQVGGVMEQVWVRAGVEDERRTLEAQARDLVRTAEQDPLTGLENRRALERFCASLPTSETVGLVLVDVDYFKQVNDQYGHAVGDAVLCEIAGILARSVRPGDRVARWGGEEFLVALPGTKCDVTETVASRMRQQVSVFDWSTVYEGLRLTMSAGVACGTAEELDEVLHRADMALYAAKRSGRNRVILG